MSAANGELSSFVIGMGRVAQLACEVVRSVFSVRLNWAELIKQMHFIGLKSQFVVLTTGASTGMVFCAQTFYQFHKVKMDNATLSVVGVAMTSELGPVLAGLMVAGRVGAAMTAEIGTMRVTEQIDALRTMATHPVDHLVVPRVLATVISMPLLTVLAWVVGIFAAMILASALLGYRIRLFAQAYVLLHRCRGCADGCNQGASVRALDFTDQLLSWSQLH